MGGCLKRAQKGPKGFDQWIEHFAGLRPDITRMDSFKCREGFKKYRLAVDVIIPSFRADPNRLSRLFAAGKSVSEANIKFLVQIDNPHLLPDTEAWLMQKQADMLNQLKVRRNSQNLGAGLTRNALLNDSHAEYVIMLDDDVVPSPDTLRAYIKAFNAHPNAAGFAGTELLQSLCVLV